MHKMGVKFSLPPATLEAVRISANEDIARFAEDVRSKVTGGASAREMAAWPNKAERARRLLAGTATPQDITALTYEVQSRGKNETPEELATLQLAKEAQYAVVVGVIDGLTTRGSELISGAPIGDIPGVMAGLQSEAVAAMQNLGIS